MGRDMGPDNAGISVKASLTLGSRAAQDRVNYAAVGRHCEEPRRGDEAIQDSCTASWIASLRLQ